MRLGLVFLLSLAAAASHGAPPVAHWDVVPHQRVRGAFNVGVVALHEDGVKVCFCVEGKERTIVESPARNPRTGVKEHFYVFDPAAAGCGDGPVRIHAVARAKNGDTTRLPPLELYADAAGTLGSRKIVYVDAASGNDYADGGESDPLQTVKAAVLKAGDGGVVRLRAGSYSATRLGIVRDRAFWTTIEAAPGVSRDDVRLTCGRIAADRVRFRNVTIVPGEVSGYTALVAGEDGETDAWFDGCRFTSPQGRFVGPVVHFARRLRAYVTGGETDDMATGPAAEIVRGHRLSRLSGTAFSRAGSLVANCVIDDVEPWDMQADVALFKFFAEDETSEGIVVYGVRATNCKASAFLATRVKDMAVANVTVDASSAPPSFHTRFSESASNALAMDVDIGAQEWKWTGGRNRKAAFRAEDVRLYGVRCGGFSGLDAADGSAGLTIAPKK